MKKLLITMFTIFILSAFSVIGATFSELGDEAIVIWNPNGNVSIDSSSYSYTVDSNVGASYDTTVFQTTPASGLFDDSTRQPITYDSLASNPLGTYKEFTTCVWTNLNANQELLQGYIHSNVNAGGDNNGGLTFQWNGATGQYRSIYIYDGFKGLQVDYNPVGGVNVPGFSQYCTVINETGSFPGGTLYNTMYHNGTQVGQTTDVPTINAALQSTTQDLLIADGPAAASRTHSGNVDCLTIYNRSLSQTEIQTLYTNGASGSCPGAVAVASPTITLVNPANNILTADDPLDINFSISLDPTALLVNVTVYVNNTLNKTLFTDANTTIVIGEGEYDIHLVVNDDLAQSGTSATSSIIIDRTNPFDNLLTMIPLNSEYSTNTNVVITASNTNLFGHNVTVRNSSNDIVFSQQVLNISLPTHGITVPIDITWGLGTYTINSSESDDHTKNIIDWETIVDMSNARITYETGTEDIIVDLEVANAIPPSGTDVNILPVLTSIQNSQVQQDRFSFGWAFPASPPAFTYYYEILVTSTDEIYQRNTEFLGHLVTGGAWLDFVPDQFTIDSLVVERISTTQVRVKIATDSPQIQFQSIGGVNFGSSVSNFQIVQNTFNAHTCDLGFGFVTCSTLDAGDTLEQTRVDCSNTDTATIGIFRDDVLLVESAASKAGDLFTLDNMDFVFTEGQTLKLNSTCTAGIGTITTTESFTATAPVVVDNSALVSTTVVFLGTALITLVVVIAMVERLRRGRK